VEETPRIPSLAARLSTIALICGLGLLFLGISSGLKGYDGLMEPSAEQLKSITGNLEHLAYLTPSKAPTVVDIQLYHKADGRKQAYLNYGPHEWEERLKPYMHKEITMFVASTQQVWGIMADGQTLVSAAEIQKTFLAVKKGQEIFATQMTYVGLGLVVFWLLFLRKRYRQSAA